MSSPTGLTLTWLRRRGYLADVVERYVSQVRRADGGYGIRRDLFGVIDVIAVKRDEKVLGVQATSLSNVPARVAKAKASSELRTFLATGATRFWVMAFTKRDGRWTPKIVELTLGDLALTATTIAKPKRRQVGRWQSGDLF